MAEYDKTVLKGEKDIEFSVFCVEAVAQQLGRNPEQVFDALTKKSSILYHYVIPCYDVLHTQGKDYIVADILSVMKEQGIEV